MASISSENRDDTTCDKCGAPASRADTITSNLSWEESLRHALDTYNLSPRRWPIGYILSSPYSPLRIEREIPGNHWRDAFEDLLTLESGGQMISMESRKKEAEVAKRLWYGSICREVDLINVNLKSNDKYMSVRKQMRDWAIRKTDTELVEGNDTIISAIEELSKQKIAAGRAKIALLKKDQGKSWPASSYKMRGQWMASLVSSGALPSWEAKTYDSSEGYQVWLGKTDGASGESDSQMLTEAELIEHFENGIPLQINSPHWSTMVGRYPEFGITRALVMDGDDVGEVKFPYVPLRPSILSQVTTAKIKESENGDRSTQVALTNVFTDGTIEKKEIVDDPSKVLEENERVYISMQEWNVAANEVILEAQHDLSARLLEKVTDDHELD